MILILIKTGLLITMRLQILPESFITNGINISNSNKCLLSSNVLEKFKDNFLDNSEGCLFKITFIHDILNITTIDYVNCIEFTAPNDTIIISNHLFDKFLLDYNSDYFLDIDIFIPPQATKVVFKIENRDIFDRSDVKSFLEQGIDKKYKFLQLNQIVRISNIRMIVKELEPYEICLINNTDLEVEFYMPTIPPPPPIIEPGEQIVNSIEDEIRLSREELRMKRLAYFDKIP